MMPSTPPEAAEANRVSLSSTDLDFNVGAPTLLSSSGKRSAPKLFDYDLSSTTGSKSSSDDDSVVVVVVVVDKGHGGLIVGEGVDSDLSDT